MEIMSWTKNITLLVQNDSKHYDDNVDPLADFIIATISSYPPVPYYINVHTSVELEYA